MKIHQFFTLLIALLIYEYYAFILRIIGDSVILIVL